MTTVTQWVVTVSCHMTKSHEEYGKIVHRPCSSYISSIQEINKDSIEFSLSTQTWTVIKLSRFSCYTSVLAHVVIVYYVCYKHEWDYNYYQLWSVMNIEWDYSYYQLWSNNEWLVNKIIALLDEDITTQ